MSTSSTKTTSAAARGMKSKQSKTITFKLPAALLSRFPHEKPAIMLSSSKSSSSTSTPTATVKDSPQASEPNPDFKNVPANGASTNLQVPTDGRKKGAGGPKAGTKRPLSALAEGQAKPPRAKPGPKKRKLDGVMNGDESGRPWTTPAPAAGHKLGPKANQGAINAGLRALDRSGKPCRKWEKKRLSVKSFTGVSWLLPTWGAPKKQKDLNGEPGQSDSPASNSENQPAPSSSNVGSEASRNHAAETNDVALSPAVVAVTA